MESYHSTPLIKSNSGVTFENKAANLWRLAGSMRLPWSLSSTKAKYLAKVTAVSLLALKNRRTEDFKSNSGVTFENKEQVKVTAVLLLFLLFK